MKLAFTFSLTLPLLLPGIAAAQQFFTVQPETRFPVELRKTIRASRARPGDVIEFRTLEPVLIGHGVVAPRDAALVGRIVFARLDNAAAPRSMIRIRVEGLRWKSGQARINAIVGGMFYARSAYIYSVPGGAKPTFMEGISITPHLTREASTDFYSDLKEVVLRKGILLQLRHIVTDDERLRTLSASSSASDQPAKK
jgi:hypothetical protein